MRGRWTAVVEGRLPGLNQWAEAKGYKARNAVKDGATARAAKALRLAGVPRLRPPVRVAVECFEPDRRRDKDNVHSMACKVALDALQRVGAIGNDGWDWCPSVPGGGVSLDRARPRVEITVEGEVDDGR